ncbi:hypothetical protein THOM_3248, partial [Trachipleistophora hominis]
VHAIDYDYLYTLYDMVHRIRIMNEVVVSMV